MNLKVDEYIHAGDIASQIRREFMQKEIEDEKILTLCTSIEDRIRGLGGTPAFPCNVGINEVAAHYTSNPEDSKTIPANSIVKIDFGVSIKGYIADTAFSLSTNPQHLKMIKASDEALNSAIEHFIPGTRLGEIGGHINRIIQNYGYKPIDNLSGHKMERFNLHAGKSVPNVPINDLSVIEEGEVYAIEPFVTTLEGAGKVIEGDEAYIFRFVKKKGLKKSEEKTLIKDIKENFGTLPFTIRWTGRPMSEAYRATFNKLITQRNIQAYPVLREKRGEPVAQSEHTVIVTHDGCTVTTI